MSERDRDQSKQSAVDSLTFIEHVASQQVRYVDDVADVSRVIERWTRGPVKETGVENGEPIHTLRVEADSETGS
jgi:dynactin complex subunit